jgi:predicted homoserine dehydrogenase-like protein
VISAFPGIRLVAIANRSPQHAVHALKEAGVDDVRHVDSTSELDQAISTKTYAVTDNAAALWESDQVDVILEGTGTIEYGARVAYESIRHGKHVVLVNVEMDATVGPILKKYADKAGVVITNADGDEPGVAMNMVRFVQSIGLTPLVAGNLKGLYDRYRNPTTQEAFARANNQKPETMTSFADGTKLSMELVVLGNAMGVGVAKRGMYGPALEHVDDAPTYFQDKLIEGGMVDFLVGAKPSNGAFVVGTTDDPMRKEYLRYLKMGTGPLYVFYRPFHLPQLEVPLTVARAALFQDATVTPKGVPTCDAVAIAKKDLQAGEILDGIGGYTCYALIENYATAHAENYLPMGVSEHCRLVRDVAKDEPVTYDDVELPAGRSVDRLRIEQNDLF